jgi:hypothetical protein
MIKCENCVKRDVCKKINTEDCESYKQERQQAEWIEKGLYGNGSCFAPFQKLYECTNCKCLTVELYPDCPECRAEMKWSEDNVS